MNKSNTKLNTPTVPQAPKPFLRQRSLVVGVGIILILLVLTGWYFLSKKDNTKMSSVPNTVSQISKTHPTPSPAFAVLPTVNPEITVNWKTYTNTKDGYTIKYPATLSADERTQENIILLTIYKNKREIPPGSDSPLSPYPTSLGIQIIRISDIDPNLHIKNANDFCEVELCINLKVDKDSKKEYVRINNLSGINLYTRIDNPQYYLDSPDGSSIFRISLIAAEGANEQANLDDFHLLQQVLSTLKFTGQANTDHTANWKTHNDNQNGYSFKYPFYLRSCNNCGITGPFSENLKHIAAFKNPNDSQVGFGGFAIYVDINKFNEPFETYVIAEQKRNYSNSGQYLKEEKIKIGDKIGVKLIGLTFGIDSYAIPFSGNKKILIVSVSGSAQFKKTMEQVFSTFKFL